MGCVTTDTFVEPARAFVHELRSRIPLRSAVLDRWGGAFRIVYDAACVEACRSDCSLCPLRQMVGSDHPDIDQESFVTTLVPASSTALAIFPARQRMLNCKTITQYLECYVTWIVECCHTWEEIEKELSLAKGFRILFMEGVADLAARERDYKRLIIRESIVRIGPGGNRAAVVGTIAARLGLLGRPPRRSPQPTASASPADCL